MKPKLVLTAGVFLVGVSFALLASGGYIAWQMASITGSDGYISSKPGTFSTETYAVSSLDININMDNFVPVYLQWLAPNDAVIVKFAAASNNASKGIFMGLGTTNDVQTYLDNIEHNTAIYYHWRISPFRVSLEINGATTEMGGAPLQSPANETFWLLSTQGSPTATMSAAMRAGVYRLVLMNADGSSTINATLQIAARFPFMDRLIILLFASGAVLGAAGGYVVYFRYIRRKQNIK